MFECNGFILKERRTESTTLFELFEQGTGRLVGVAQFERAKPWHPSRFHVWHQGLIDKHRWLGTGLAVLIALIYLPSFILSSLVRGKLPSRERPRLSLKQVANDSTILTVRQSSGMFHDSRVVHNGEGQAIAQFRGPSKIPLGELSFGIIDLGGENRNARDYDELPWLGSVRPAKPGVFALSLVGLPNAGKVVEHQAFSHAAKVGVNSYEIEASVDLKNHHDGMILLLGVALAMAWRPGS